MQILLDQHKRLLVDFIGQGRKCYLLLKSPLEDRALVLKLLRQIETESEHDLYLLFSCPFVDAHSYAYAVGTALANEHAQWAAQHCTAPAFPPALLSAEQRPASLLRALISLSTEWLPPQVGHRVVWALCPLAVTDAGAYAELLRDVCQIKDRPSAWQRQSRLILAYSQSPEISSLLCSPWAAQLELPLSPESLAASLERTSQERGLSERERAEALLMLAYTEQANGNCARALSLSQEVLLCAQGSNNSLLEAMAMSCIGEGYAAVKDLEQARIWFETATIPASESGAVALLGSLARNLAQVCFGQGDYHEAATYWDLLAQLAQRMDTTDVGLMAVCGRAASLYAGAELAAAKTSHAQGMAMLKVLRPDLAEDGLHRELARFYEISGLQVPVAVEQQR